MKYVSLKSNPPLPLEKFAGALANFRQEIFTLRADLTAPGYYLDLDAADATRTALALAGVKEQAENLTACLNFHERVTHAPWFAPLLILLENLAENPLHIFSAKGEYLYSCLSVEDIVFSPAEIGKAKPKKEPIK